MSILAKESIARPYIQYCGEVFFTPKFFFRNHFQNASLGKVMAFGILTVWLSSIILFVYDSALLLFLNKYFGSMNSMSSIFNFNPTSRSEEFIQEVSLLLLNPYFTLSYMVLVSLGIFASAKLFVPSHVKNKVSFNNCLKIFSVATVGAWFAIVPIMGFLLNYLVGLLLLVTGMKEVFEISTTRSLVIILAPQILFITLIVSLVGLFFLMLAIQLAPDIYQVLQELSYLQQ